MTPIKNCLWERTSTIPKRNSIGRKGEVGPEPRPSIRVVDEAEAHWRGVLLRRDAHGVNGNHRAIMFEPTGRDITEACMRTPYK